jgi:hypothetical protein
MEIRCQHEFPPDPLPAWGNQRATWGGGYRSSSPFRRLRMDGSADLPRGRRDGTLLSGG